jgi:hypothetical protein
MAISYHPDYTDWSSIWTQMRDTSSGEHAVKAGTTKYLPKTQGQEADKVDGNTDYLAYLMRCVWYDYLRNTQKDSIGLLHREGAAVSLPPAIDSYATEATDDGDDVNMLLRRINEQQLITGRVGLLLDMVAGHETPITTIHYAERIVNWDEDGKWIVLDESSYVTDVETLNYEWCESYKLLALDSHGQYFNKVFTQWSAAYLADPVDGDGSTYPEYRGRRLNVIPFTFVNASTLMRDVEQPPLLPLSNACLSIFRGEADYRQTLFMQGFAVLFLKNFKEDELGRIRIGSGTYISTVGDDADAKFLEVAGRGLGEMRNSQENLKKYSSDLGIELQNGSSAAESGKALSTRLTIRTASLETLAVIAASAVSKQIGYLVEWTGVQGDYSVMPNLDFIEQNESAEELLKMSQAFKSGAITQQDYWSWLRAKDFTKLTFEEFQKATEDSMMVEGLERKIQQLYLGVDKLITWAVGRDIRHDSGANLDEEDEVEEEI